MSVNLGKKKEVKEFKNELYTGFASVRVLAVNPTREELNKMLGKEPSENDKEFVYLGADDEGNERLRLAFWLYDENKEKYFVHSFNLINKFRSNKDGTKAQIVNSTCTTSWVPFKVGKNGVTDKVDETVIQDWFLQFTSKDKEVIGTKKWRKAIIGEEELVTVLRSMLGRLDWFDPDTEVLIDMNKLFKEDYTEITSLITPLGDESDEDNKGFDTPFVALMGVRTDEQDPSKKYQQVWGKGFLPNGFMRYINNGNKMPTEGSRKIWNRFLDEVEGEYGFSSYYKLTPLMVYDEKEDIAGGATTKAPQAPATSPKY